MMRNGTNRASLADERELHSIVIQAGANANPSLDQSDVQWLQSMAQNEIKQNGRSKIQKVPWVLRKIEKNEKCYEPSVVSIGPYHHGKDQFIQMEEHKQTVALQYVDGNALLLEILYKKVMDVATEARECYDDDESLRKLDEKQFTRIMFLDGCFILQYIYCLAHNKSPDLKLKDNVRAFVQRDLLLLENQIPYQVLKELMICSKFKDESEWRKSFSKFVEQIRPLPHQQKKAELYQPKEDHQPAHLLDLFRSHLFDKDAFKTAKMSRSNSSDWYSYRSAKELKAVGIYFRPSKTNRITDVDFKSMGFTAFLKLPPVYIDDSTKSMLLNLVAYEACPDGPDDFGVSSYICLMDSLIDHAEDVKELRSKGILLNFLGSDQQVADLFNEIADNLVPNPKAYVLVKNRIEKHYKNKFKIWLAEWLHTHFSSPWTVLAFMGAVFALFLTVIQTIESFNPNKDKK